MDSGHGKLATRFKTALWTIVCFALLLTSLAGVGFFQFGSLGALIAFLQGRILYVEPASVLIDALKPGESSLVTVRIRNLASAPIKLLGASARPHCGCLIAKDLPTELAAGEAKDLPVQFRVPSSGAVEFEFVVEFYTNVAGERPQAFLHGHVQSADSAIDKPRSES